jgi:hypothetical protein
MEQQIFVGAKVKLVCEEFSYGGVNFPRKEYEAEVTRVTKQHAVINGHKFRLSDGCLATRYSNRYRLNTHIV